MASTTEPSHLTSMTFSRSPCDAIAHYLNTAIALQPPLTVAGQPPQLKIYLPPQHLCSIALVLSQIELRLRALQAMKYWDVYVYADDASPPRLIHHVLLEKSQLPSSGLPAVPLRRSGSLLLGNTPFSEASSDHPVPGLRFEASATGHRTFPHPRRSLKRRHRHRVTVGTVSVMVTICAVGAGLAGIGRSQLAQWAHLLRFNRGLFPNAADSSQSVSRPTAVVSSTPMVENANGRSLPAAFSEPGEYLTQPLTRQIGIESEATTPVNTAPSLTAVKLKAVGDIIPGTNYPDYRIPQNPATLFEGVKMFMGEVDIVFGNFESTLTNHPYSAKDISRGMTFAFRTPPKFAEILQVAGFDVLSVANNHSFDFGNVGFEDTIAHINQAGIQAVGRKDEILFVEANGYTVAFIGFSYWDAHNSMLNLERAIALVQSAQSQADMVVVSVHAGAEGTDAMAVRNQTEYFFSENRGNMVQFSHAMIDAGADLILGHGPHVPRAIELYRDKLIAYSLGNFLGYRTLSTVGALGKSLILQVELDHWTVISSRCER